MARTDPTRHDTGQVILLGATGFTGRLTAQAMVRAGLAPVLAGRDPQRLQELTRELFSLAPAGKAPSWQQADVTDPDSVDRLINSSADVLVSTVGPFGILGEAAVQATLNHGCAYIDSTGEAGFIKSIFDRDAEFQASGARVIPACGYDFIPGNLAGAIALRNCRDRGDIPGRVDIGYFTKGPMAMSSGTKASAVASLMNEGHRFRGGQLTSAALGTEFREFTLASGTTMGGISIGGTEQFGLPRMSPSLIDVNVYLGWAGKWSKPVAQIARLTQPLKFLPGATVVTKKLTDQAMMNTGVGPTGSDLFRGKSIAVAEVYDLVGHHLETVHVEGPAPYPLTAELLAWSAAMALFDKVKGTGALDPISAFGLGPFIAGSAAAGLRQVRFT